MLKKITCRTISSFWGNLKVGKNLLLSLIILMFACVSFSQNQWGNLDKPWSVKEFKINEKHYYENTVAVIAPGENSKCKNGKVIVMTGSKREDRRMIISDLYTGQANQQKLNTAIGTDVTLGINSNIETLATDNQIVKLNDGSLLAIKLGFLWSNLNPKPFWWNWYDSKESEYKPGTRDAMFVYKSMDCGATWDNISKIDAAKLDVGQYGVPRIEDVDDDDKQDEDEDGKGLWHSNGFDRQEVYYDKWTEKIYITTQIASGVGGINHPSGFDKYGVLMSSDKGKTWSLLKNGFTNKRIIVMTTNPNGRFFMFSASKGKPVLYFTRQTKDFDLSSLDSIDISCKGDYPNYPANAPTKEQFLSLHQSNKLPTFSIARGYSISSDASAFSSIYVSFPVLNPQGKVEFMLVKVDFKYVTATKKLSVDYKCHAVRASDASRSLGYGTLVESNKQGIDFGDGAAVKVDTKTLFFYLESTTGKDFTGTEVAAFKGMLINNRTNDFSPKFFLSKDSNNNDRWFTPGKGIGHYTKGAYFAWGFQQHYAAQWSEDDGIHVSVISGVDLVAPQ
jgi:hypothetical protein